MAQTILYYPTIDIQDGQWLRNAILYWDKVASIVPYGDYLDFSPELLYLEENALYEPIYPQNLFNSEYVTDFQNAIVRRIDRYSKTDANKVRGNTQTVRIHKNKINDSTVFHYLESNKYIKENSCGEWMEIYSNVAAIYMHTLAEYTIKCYPNDIVLGTDKPEDQYEIYSLSTPQPNSACFSLALNNCLPEPTMDVGLEPLLDFKEKRKQDLLQFRQILRDFEIVLYQCSSDEEIKFRTEVFKESWQREIMQAKKMFKEDHITCVLGSLCELISAPSIAVALEQVIQNNIPGASSSLISHAILGGVAAIDLSYQFVKYNKKINEHRSSPGFAYLIKASKEGIINPL